MRRDKCPSCSIYCIYTTTDTGGDWVCPKCSKVPPYVEGSILNRVGYL